MSADGSWPGSWRAFPRAPSTWKAVHTGRYVYIETQGDRPERWTRDPPQPEGLHDDPADQELRHPPEGRLDELRPGWRPRSDR